MTLNMNRANRIKKKIIRNFLNTESCYSNKSSEKQSAWIDQKVSILTIMLYIYIELHVTKLINPTHFFLKHDFLFFREFIRYFCN